MKKHSLFKTILIVLGCLVGVSFILAILGYFIPSLEGKFSFIALFDVGLNYVQSFYYFFDTVVYLLVIGAFYEVLNLVPAYKKLIDNIALKLKANSKLFVFLMIVLFAAFTSLTGLTNVLLIFVPFVISIILILGYDKLVAVSSTIVAMFVGFIGGIFVTFRDPNSYYGYSSTTLEKLVGVSSNTTLWPKLILLVLGIALLIFFVNRHIKNVQDKKVKYELNDSNEVTVSEVKGDYKNIKTWPMIIMLVLIFVVLVMGYFPWNSLFGIECFDKFNEWLLGLKIHDFAVFSNIISGNIYAFGNWGSLGSYMAIVITLITFTLIIKVIYKVKFDEVLSNFVDGAKRMVPIVLLVVLTYTILVCAYNTGFVSTIITWISESKIGLNVVTSSIITALGTLLHSDLYYTVAGAFMPMISAVADESMYGVYAMTFQSIYGLISIIGPTSLLLIVVLKYFDIPYTSWVKYIWRFVLMLLLIIILVLFILALI
ncbi:MAG: hypothetical protein ACI31S_00490 [Bacilli bacterium]